MKQVFFLLLLGLTACTNPTKEAASGQFYDLKSYIEKQIAVLNKKKPTVEKQIGLADGRDLKTTNEIDWTRELDLFLQADINKQAYQASYQVTRPDSLTYEYQLKEGEKLPVGYLKILLDSVSRQPKRIEAILATKNSLYESKRMVWLQTKQGAISKYHIEGYQQLAWLDKKPFLIEGKIR